MEERRYTGRRGGKVRFLKFFALLWFIGACSNFEPTGAAYLPLAGGQVPILNPCRDLNFVSGHRTLTPGKMLGQGVYGRVYELVADRKPVNDFVLKTIKHQRLEFVKRVTAEEVQLSQNLPEFYTPTEPRGVFRRSDLSDPEGFIGLLLKKRVNGYVLYDIAINNAKDLSQDYHIIYQSFAKFRQDFINKLDELSTRDIYIHDFHQDNIMYDQLEKKWYLVDANFESSWQDFLSELEFYNTTENLGTRVKKIYDHVSRYPNGPPLDAIERQEFFTVYADIYLGPYFENLRILAEYYSAAK